MEEKTNSDEQIREALLAHVGVLIDSAMKEYPYGAYFLHTLKEHANYCFGNGLLRNFEDLAFIYKLPGLSLETKFKLTHILASFYIDAANCGATAYRKSQGETNE